MCEWTETETNIDAKINPPPPPPTCIFQFSLNANKTVPSIYWFIANKMEQQQWRRWQRQNQFEREREIIKNSDHHSQKAKRLALKFSLCLSLSLSLSFCRKKASKAAKNWASRNPRRKAQNVWAIKWSLNMGKEAKKKGAASTNILNHSTHTYSSADWHKCG